MKTIGRSKRPAVSSTAIAVIIVVVALVAGAGGYLIHSSSKVSAPKQKVTITYFDDLAPSEATFMTKTVIPMFEKEYPNITVTYVNEGASSIVNSVKVLEQGGNVGPVIIGEDNMVIGELLYSGYLMNLTGSVANSIMPKSLIPSMTGIVNYEKTQFKGIYFIPLRANVPLVFYRKQALAAAGYTSPPQNLSGLMQAAKTIYSDTGVKPLMFQGHGGASTPTELFQWMVQFGGNPMLINDSGDVQTFQYLWNASQYFSPDYTTGYWGSYKGLASGKYDILDYQWPYVYNELTGPLAMNSTTLGVYAGPAGPKIQAHIIGGDVLAIPKGATDVPALVDFARFLLSTTVQRDFIVDLSWPAVNQAAYTNLPSNISVVYSAIEQALEHPVFRPPVPWITEWNAVVDKAWTQIIVDHASYSQIPGILSSANQEMYNYLSTTYNTTVANAYESGAYGPLVPS